MFCRNCGKEMAQQAIFCPSCGCAPASGKKFCQNCGKPTDPIAEVCVKCGVHLAGEAKSKIVAGILGIIVGWCGVHRFCQATSRGWRAPESARSGRPSARGRRLLYPPLV
jgi:hypothetical protein